MARTETPPEVRRYLQELDAALMSIDPDVADEIRNGVAEELTALPPEDAHERIAQLGDVRFIAAEAIAASKEIPLAKVRRPLIGSRIYAIVAAVVVMVGAFVVPLVGWALGYVLVVLSPVWRGWEKVVAAAVPLGLTVTVGGFFAITGWATADASASGNPLIALLPVALSNAAITLAISNAIVGTWLLVRALTRP